MSQRDPLYSNVSKRGQTTIPAEVRRALRIEPGDRLEYSIQGEQAVVRVHRGLAALKGRSGQRARKADVDRPNSRGARQSGAAPCGLKSTLRRIASARRRESLGQRRRRFITERDDYLATSHGSGAPAGGSFTISTPVTSLWRRTSSSAAGEGSLSRFKTATASPPGS